MSEPTMTPAEPTELVISVKTAEAVVNYLATRPYIEVYQLVALMQQLKPLPEPEPIRLHTGTGGIALAAQQAEE